LIPEIFPKGRGQIFFPVEGEEGTKRGGGQNFEGGTNLLGHYDLSGRRTNIYGTIVKR